jgi:hypothetical protein
MQHEVALGLMRILIEMVDALGIKRGGAPLQAVNFVSLGEQKFRQIGAILPRNPRDQSALRQTPTSRRKA